MIAAQLIEMLQLQDRMNKTVNPDWLTAGYSWTRAALVESVELIEHLGWKWWKKQTPDTPQAQMEVIDIWHFVLSHELVAAEGNIQKAALSLMEGWTTPISKVYIYDGEKTADFASMELRRKVELFGAVGTLTGNLVVPIFRNIAEDLGILDARLYELYMSKNALNMFRQAHGYKDGTYIKDWFGREDNEVMREIIDTTENVTFAGLLQRLEMAYTEVLQAQRTA